MSDDVLQVNPPALAGAGTAFGRAASGIAGLRAAAADEYGDNLRSAAARYESVDQAGRDAIAKVALPGG